MLKVIKVKGQGVVSDAGRWGHAHLGVPLGGVVDSFSFEVGNMALGNHRGAACLEFMGQFDLVCTRQVRVFLANRGGQALLNGHLVHSGRVLALQEGDLLSILPTSLGVWTLLCVEGGVEVPPVLNSRSTCLAAGFGGYRGRALKAGDELATGGMNSGQARNDNFRLAMPLAARPGHEPVQVHCLCGPEYDNLTDTSRKIFDTAPWRVGLQSSRMAYRLETSLGQLALESPVSMRSHAVHPGIVQLPPSGYPVVLLSEAQVTGGYPRIASVLGCELWKFAQLRPGQSVVLKRVDPARAGQLMERHQKEFMRYAQSIQRRGKDIHVD